MRFAIIIIWCTAAVSVSSAFLVQDQSANAHVKSDAGQKNNHTIIFECRQWEGDYWSRDVENGTEISPHTSAIFMVPEGGGVPPRQIPVGTELNPGAPKFSPDGQWVYFQARKEGRWNVFRCRADGTQIVNLTGAHTPFGDRFGYSFSRDGTKVLLTYNDGRIGRVVIMDPEGTNPHLVAPELGYHYMADISPDNSSVVFAHTEKGYTLVLKRLDTGELKNLTPGLRDCFLPGFTPNGKTIIFFRRGGDVYRVDADGSGLNRLTVGNDYDTFYLSPGDKHGSSDGPSLSPDGKRIAYIAKRDGVSQVYVMDVDGSQQQQLTFRPTPCGRVAFSPDGKQIAFVSWVDKGVQLFVIDSNGGKPRQITNIQGAVYQLAWQPNTQ